MTHTTWGSERKNITSSIALHTWDCIPTQCMEQQMPGEEVHRAPFSSQLSCTQWHPTDTSVPACTAPRAAPSKAGSSRRGSPSAWSPPARIAPPPRPPPLAGPALPHAQPHSHAILGIYVSHTARFAGPHGRIPASCQYVCCSKVRTHDRVLEVAQAHGLCALHGVAQVQQRREVRAVRRAGRGHVPPPPRLGGQQRIDVLRHLLRRRVVGKPAR